MNETPGLFTFPDSSLARTFASFFCVLMMSISGMHAQPASPGPPDSNPTESRGTTGQTPDAAQELLQVFQSKENITNSLGSVFIHLEQGYRVGACEVTQAEYEKVIGSNPSRFKGTRQPVEQVSWNQAREFCAQLTRQEQEAGKLPKGFHYTLPTEAQWEYFVDDATLEQAIVSLIGDRPKPFPVGSLPANDFGLHDVRGNVWEWCASPVARGGSYMSHGDYLMISFRYTATPTATFEDVGFRCILVEK